jgi:hypothetical protein
MSNEESTMNRISKRSTHSSNTDTREKLSFLDLCNNEFIFINENDNFVSFEYKPVDPIRSCSGSYSGGTPVFKKLHLNEWLKLMTINQNSKTQGRISTERYKGTLVLTYQSETMTDTLILASNEYGVELQKFFHSYRS